MGTQNNKPGNLNSRIDNSFQNGEELTFDSKYRVKIRIANKIEEILDILNKAKENMVGPQKEKLFDDCIKSVENINQKMKNLKMIFSEKIDPKEKQAFVQHIIEKGEDPFEGLQDIPDKNIIHQIVKIILRDKDIKKFFILFLHEKQNDAKEKWLREIADKSQDTSLKEYINDFLNGTEYLRNNPDNVKGFSDKWIDSLQKIQEKYRESVNLDTIFNIEPGFKENLAKEIREKILGKTFEEDDEENGDDFGEEIEFEAIKSFYKKYLSKNKRNPLDYIKKNDLGNLIQDLEKFIANKDDTIQTPTIDKFLELLEQKWNEIISQETLVSVVSNTANNESANINTDNSSTSQTEKKKEEKPDWWTDVKTVTLLGSVNLGFSILTSLVFGPVTMAIWLSKARLDIKKGTFNTSDYKDLLPTTAFEEKKDKK